VLISAVAQCVACRESPASWVTGSASGDGFGSRWRPVLVTGRHNSSPADPSRHRGALTLTRRRGASRARSRRPCGWRVPARGWRLRVAGDDLLPVTEGHNSSPADRTRHRDPLAGDSRASRARNRRPHGWRVQSAVGQRV